MKEQEVDTITAPQHWLLAEALQDVSRFGWRTIGILFCRDEFVAFLQRDRPAKPEEF